MSRINYGQVELELGDEVYTLKPTLNACEKIEARWGSIISACRDAEAMKFSNADIALVVMAGAGLGQRQLQQIRQAVFDAGQVTVLAGVAPYLSLLLNPTGQDLDEEEPDEGEA